MGIYRRKSSNAGPLRINFSTSGVGASIGKPGLRVGHGPRGTYVHLGAHGVHYRRWSSPRRDRDASGRPPVALERLAPSNQAATMGVDAGQLHPTGPGDLVEQLRSATRHRPAWPAVVAVLVLMVGVATRSSAVWVPYAALAVAVATFIVFWRWERAKRTATVVYEMSGPVAQWFDALVVGFPAMVGLGGAWRVETSSRVVDTYRYKVSGGAETEVGRGAVSFALRPPRTLAANIAVPTILHKQHALLFLPDRMLVRSGADWTDVDYGRLQVDCVRKQTIEHESPPRDAVQVGTRWKYVNVRTGKPDRRYRHNRLLPVLRYGHLTLATPDGLNWVIDCSRPEVAEWFTTVLAARPT